MMTTFLAELHMSLVEKTVGRACGPLMAAAGAHLYRRNPFRVTGLPVDVSVREISKQAAKLQMMLELGRSEFVGESVFPLDPPPTLDEIREAIEKIKDPQNRLVYEFFWLWPAEWGQSRTDPAIQAWNASDGEMALKIWTLKENQSENALVASHNLAVFWHLVALDWEKRLADMDVDIEMARTVEEYWQMSAKRWHALLSNDAFWIMIDQRIRQMNDPRLTLEFGSSLRFSLAEALIKINAELALRHLESGHRELAALHVRLVKGMVSDASKIQTVFESVMSPTIERLQQQIRRVRQGSEAHPEFAGRSANDLAGQAFPLFSLYKLIQGETSRFDADIFQETTIVCTNAAVAFYRATKDNAVFVSLLERILPMAVTPELRQRVELNISIGKTNLERDRFQPLLQILDKVQSTETQAKSKLWRIRDQVVTQITAMSAADRTTNPVVLELCDNTAGRLLQIATDAVNLDHDRELAAEALDLACRIVNRLDLKEQLLAARRSLPKPLTLVETPSAPGARRQSVETLNKRMESIQGASTPAERLARIKKEILGASQDGSDKWDLDAEDALAGELRKLSLLAFNEFSDAETAWSSIELAVGLAHNSKLVRQTQDDSRDMARLRAILDQEVLLLNIRDTAVQITGQKVRVNDKVLPSASIAGFRLSDGEDRKNFRIDLQTLDSELIPLDCKRFLRSERKVAEDFEQIAQALRLHVAPLIAWRVARYILSGQTYPLTEAGCYDFVHEMPSAPGLRLSANVLNVVHFAGIPKMEIPLFDLVFEKTERGCFLRSQSAPPIRVCSLWNGCCLGLILETLNNAKTRNLSSYARRPE